MSGQYGYQTNTANGYGDEDEFDTGKQSQPQPRRAGRVMGRATLGTGPKKAAQATGTRRFAKKSENAPLQKSSQQSQPEQAEVSAFNFSMETTEVVESTEETSAFDFISTPQKSQLDEESGFSFIEAPKILPKGKDPTSFIRQMTKYYQELQENYNSQESLKQQIADLEQQVAQAVSNGQFAEAEKLNAKLDRASQILVQTISKTSRSVENAMTLVNDAPTVVMDHVESTQTELPEMIVSKDELEKKLMKMVQEQGYDKAEIDAEKMKSAQFLSDLGAPLLKQRENFQKHAAELDSKILACKAPFESKKSEFEAKKEEHNAKILDLLQQIENHKKEIQQLDSNIADSDEEMKKALEELSPEVKQHESDSKRLNLAEDSYKQKVKDIQAPYNTLLARTESREVQIQQITTSLDQKKKDIEDAEKDASQCKQAAETLNKLLADYRAYSDRKKEVNDQLNAAAQTLASSEQRRTEINTQTNELQSAIGKARKYLSEANDQLPQLEANKKTAVASKNFKGAQQCTDQIKELEDSIAQKQNIIDTNEAHVAALTKEVSELNEVIARAGREQQQAKSVLIHLDFNFFSQGMKVLDELFDDSPFTTKLLAPLKDLYQFSLDHTEQPVKLSKSEIEAQLTDLNAKLSVAVSSDEFDLAQRLQEQIEQLNISLESAE